MNVLPSIKSEKVFLKYPENDEQAYEIWKGNRKSGKEENTFMQLMQKKYAHLLPAVIEFATLINETYQNFGERHFADTFGKKTLIIFNREGLLLEDYEATDSGVLKDLVD